MSYQKNYPNGWQSGEAGGTPITPEAMNNIEYGIANSLPKDGTDPMAGNLPMGGYRVTGVGNPVEDGDAVPLGYAGEHFAPAGYGLGGGSTVKKVTDIVANGWYITNEETPTGAWYLCHAFVTNNGKDVTVEAWHLDGITKCKRTKRGGTWGPWEYYNPPMEPGVEYRTTERHMGLPVYAVAVQMGTLGNASTIIAKIPVDKISGVVAIKGIVYEEDSVGATHTAANPIGACGGLSDVWISPDGQYVRALTTSDLSAKKLTVTVKYLKS